MSPLQYALAAVRCQSTAANDNDNPALRRFATALSHIATNDLERVLGASAIHDLIN